MRRPRWFRWPYRSQRRRAATQAAAEAEQEAEHQAARQRLLDLARGNAGPTWNGPTRPLPRDDRPLMTRAQAWRGNGGRW